MILAVYACVCESLWHICQIINAFRKRPFNGPPMSWQMVLGAAEQDCISKLASSLKNFARIMKTHLLTYSKSRVTARDIYISIFATGWKLHDKTYAWLPYQADKNKAEKTSFLGTL